MTNNYAIILAGGSGTRFWPLSRNERPKQLLKLLSKESLLQQSINRLDGIINKDNILILTNETQADEVKKQAPEIPEANIIIEPVRRDTAPAIALGIAFVKSKSPDANMVIIPSDQLISNEDAFKKLIKEALATASTQDALITIGIKPTWPCPSYGYIERGALIDDCSNSEPCYEVKHFREKPDIDTARQYLINGNYSWNAGMFVWSIPTVLKQLEKHSPELADFIKEASRTPDISNFTAKNFPTLTSISIDFALMEKADKVLNFEATFDWDDVGSWISVANYLAKYESNSSNAALTHINAKDNIVFCSSPKKHVALLGVHSVIVVDTEDALLVADKNKADDIKNIVSKLPDGLL